MNKKSFSSVLMILIVVGIVMSIFNFSIKAYASQTAIFGTTTEVHSILLQSWYTLNNRHLEDNLYCIGRESNCTIVFVH